MSEASNFALVPRLSNAIDKTPSGQRRVLSEMVSEMLVLAKHGVDGPEEMCDRGLEFAKSGHLDRAFGCYKYAAERGLARAQYLLGRCFADGSGVAEDWVEAYFWLSFHCSQQEYQDPTSDMIWLAGELSRKQWVEIDQRVRSFKPIPMPGKPT